MTTPTDSKRFELVKLTDANDENNYVEFEYKARVELRAQELWTYIEGPDSSPPLIPKLLKEVKVKGKDANGDEHEVIVQTGNEADVKAALTTAKPWLDGDAKALAAIVRAVPQHKIHLVKACKTAKQAWNALRFEY